MDTKRAYGTGSIYFRTRDQRWAAAYATGKGKARKRRVFTSKDKAAVEEWLDTNAEPPARPIENESPYWKLERDAGPYSATLYADNVAKLRAQRGRCCYCGRFLSNGWELDHAIPLTRGGSNASANLAISCRQCNRAKGNLTPEEFMAWAKQSDYFTVLGPLPDRDNRRARMAKAARSD